MGTNKRHTLDLESERSEYETRDGFINKIMVWAYFRWVVNQINTFRNGRSISLLEIGCGPGDFLTLMRRLPVHDLDAVELDPRLVEVARARSDARVLSQSAEELDLAGKTYDVVCSFQVIEHLFEPECFLDGVKTCMHEGSIFILSTPNSGGLAARRLGEEWSGIREDHVSLKPVNEWREFLLGNGFEVTYWGTTFFSGFPVMRKFPLSLLNAALVSLIGAISWEGGESSFFICRKKKAD